MSGIIKMVGLFDDEEVGSLLRQGARSNFLPSTVERICEAFGGDNAGANLVSQTYANSFLISADVTHAGMITAMVSRVRGQRLTYPQ